jgi:hypothetical protein
MSARGDKYLENRYTGLSVSNPKGNNSRLSAQRSRAEQVAGLAREVIATKTVKELNLKYAHEKEEKKRKEEKKARKAQELIDEEQRAKQADEVIEEKNRAEKKERRRQELMEEEQRVKKESDEAQRIASEESLRKQQEEVDKETQRRREQRALSPVRTFLQERERGRVMETSSGVRSNNTITASGHSNHAGTITSRHDEVGANNSQSNTVRPEIVVIEREYGGNSASRTVQKTPQTLKQRMEVPVNNKRRKE